MTNKNRATHLELDEKSEENSRESDWTPEAGADNMVTRN